MGWRPNLSLTRLPVCEPTVPAFHFCHILDIKTPLIQTFCFEEQLCCKTAREAAKVPSERCNIVVIHAKWDGKCKKMGGLCFLGLKHATNKTFFPTWLCRGMSPRAGLSLWDSLAFPPHLTIK